MKRIIAAILSVAFLAPLARAEYNVLNFGVDRGADPKTIGVYYGGTWYPLGNFSTSSPYFSLDASAITSGTHGWLSLDDLSDTAAKFPGLSDNVQGAGLGPGLDGGTWLLFRRLDSYSSLPTFRADKYSQIGCPGDATGATCGSTGQGLSAVRNAVTINASTNPDNAEWQWAMGATYYNMSRPGMAAQNGGGFAVAQKVRPVSSTTSATGDGSEATLTFGTTGIVGSPYVFPVGYDIFVSGVTPSGYNGRHTVSASSPGSVTFISSTTGAQTVAGKLGHAITACSVVTGNLVKIEYSHPGTLVPITGSSGTGSVATLTFDPKYEFLVNDQIVVAGMGAYNGTHNITEIGSGYVKYSSAATGSLSGGTIAASQWRPQETVRIGGVSGATGFNGNWKIQGTSASTNDHPGPGWVVIDYGSPPSCAGFSGGYINNISVGPTWGGWNYCMDATGVSDPGTNSATSPFTGTSEACHGNEFNVIVNNPDGATTLTDANANRIISHLVARSNGFSSPPHVGVGLSISASSTIIDKGLRLISVSGSYGNGIDLTGAVINDYAILLSKTQKISFAGNSLSDEHYLRHANVSGTDKLQYVVDNAEAFSMSDAGTFRIVGDLTVTSLPTSAGAGGLYLCVDTTGVVYKKSSCP